MAQDPQPIKLAQKQSRKSVSLSNITRRRLFRRKSAIVGMVIRGVLVFIAIAAPWFAPYYPIQSMLDADDYPGTPHKRSAPCIHALGCPEDQAQHIMGLDGNIRDEFSRILYGARLSLMIGLTTVTFAIIIGSVLGAVSGYFGGGRTTSSCAAWMCCWPFHRCCWRLQLSRFWVPGCRMPCEERV